MAVKLKWELILLWMLMYFPLILMVKKKSKFLNYWEKKKYLVSLD